jgi:hypothetical protein
LEINITYLQIKADSIGIRCLFWYRAASIGMVQSCEGTAAGQGYVEVFWVAHAPVRRLERATSQGLKIPT